MDATLITDAVDRKAMAQPPPQQPRIGAPQQQAPYPPYPYPYPYWPPPPRRDNTLLIVVIIVVVMVAGSAIMAAILHAVVSGLVSGPITQPKLLGLSVSRNPPLWIITITLVRGDWTVPGTTLTIYRSDGTMNLTATPLVALDPSLHGASFSGNDNSLIEIGEQIVLSTAWYGTGSRVVLVGQNAVVETALAAY